MASRAGLMRSPQEYSRTRNNHWQHPSTVVKKPQLRRAGVCILVAQFSLFPNQAS